MPDTTASPTAWLEPSYYQKFSCLGAACEDTCCQGWAISVDRNTYYKYQECSEPLAAQLRELVILQPSANDRQYARIQLEEARCPLLQENLCSVHGQLGEEYLGQACASFPRIVSRAGEARERSLDLSCPEAARLALLNPALDLFTEKAETADLMDGRLREIAEGKSSVPAPYFGQIRGFLLGLLQDRCYRVEHRLVLAGHVCDKLSELTASATDHLIPEVLEGFALGMNQGLFDKHLAQCSANPATQLAIVLELVVARVGLDYTSQRYRDLYQEFMSGLGLQANSSMPELGGRYAEAYEHYYEPFMASHEYMLEHYLVGFAFKNQFPFGPVADTGVYGAVTAQYLLMSSYFAITRALLVGMAGYKKTAFGEQDVIRAVQACSRTLEHCTSYPARVLAILAGKGVRNAMGMMSLTQAPVPPRWNRFAASEALDESGMLK